VLFHGEATDRAPGTTIAILKMRAWPSGPEELVLDLECKVPDPALNPNEVLVGGDGVVYQHQCRRSIAVLFDQPAAKPQQHDGEILVDDARGAKPIKEKSATLKLRQHLVSVTLALVGTVPAGHCSGGGAVSVATGEVWLAQGTDHGGSLRGPGSHCSVVGLRPSPGRVTRGTVGNLWSQLSVQGPMVRSAADLALFLDAMAGFCPLDPLTFDAPSVSFSEGVARPVAPKRVAFTADYNGRMPIDQEVRDICTKAARRFEELGCVVEEASPDIGAADEAFHILRGQHFVVDHELQLRDHRDKLKPDIIWNTERGLAQTPSDIARAERERAAFYRRMVEFFGTYDLLVTPGALTPAFDVNLRNAPTIGGQKLDNYMGGSTVTAVMTLSACPAMVVPSGFDQYGRPVGLQLVGKPRGEPALLQAAALFEQLTGLDRLLPIDPKPGAVPPIAER
jgi:amidase